MSIKKIGISLAVVGTLAVGTWLGASIYVGRTTSKWVGSLVEQTAKQKTLRLVNLQHKQGLFSSEGQFEVRLNDLGADLSTGKQKLSVVVDYRISNLLLPESSMRFDWNMKPAGEYGVVTPARSWQTGLWWTCTLIAQVAGTCDEQWQ
jgi:hypothetical protein